MSKSRKRKKGFTTKNTHIPKRVSDFVSKIEKQVNNYTDGDIAVLHTQLLTASDDDLWNEFTGCLSEGLYLPYMEKFRKDFFTDKPFLDKPITNVECMMIGVVMRGDNNLKKLWIPKLRDTETMLPFTMAQLCRTVSDIRECIPYSKIQNVEKNVNWE